MDDNEKWSGGAAARLTIHIEVAEDGDLHAALLCAVKDAKKRIRDRATGEVETEGCAGGHRIRLEYNPGNAEATDA